MPKSKTPVAIMALIMAAIGIALPLCLASFAIERHPPIPPAPTVAPTQASLTTISVLFIGDDSLTTPQPVLESLTVVKYRTQVRKFSMFTVSPDTNMGSGKKLRDYYAEDSRVPRQALVTQFALRKISPELGTIYAEVDFDRQTISETIGLLAPFECMGQTQTADELLGLFDALAPEAAAQRMHFQGNLLQCLFVAAQKQNWDFPKLLVSLGRRFYPTRDLATVTFEAAPPLVQSEFTVFCTPLDPFARPTPKP